MQLNHLNLQKKMTFNKGRSKSETKIKSAKLSKIVNSSNNFDENFKLIDPNLLDNMQLKYIYQGSKHVER